MPSRIVLYYNQGAQGWTETFYVGRSTSILADVQPQDKPVLANAIEFRAPLTQLVALRYTDLINPRQTSLIKLGGQYVSNLSGSSKPDVVSSDAVWGLYGDTVGKRRISVRGLPDDSIIRTSEGIDTLTPGFRAACIRYFTSAGKAGWQLRYQKTPQNSALQYHNIINIAPDPANPNWSILTAADAVNLDLTINSGVRFLGAPRGDLAGFPVKTFVVALDPLNTHKFSIPYRWRGGANFGPRRMQAIKIDYLFAELKNFFFERFSERKTGRPFGSLRGRGRAVASAR